MEQHTHAIEPELFGTSPRAVRWSASTVASRRLLWNLMAGTALVMLFLGRNDLATWDALIARGVPVTASVYDKHVSRGKSTTYSLRYTFYGDGLMCYGSDSVSRSAFEAANIGDTIPVTYLPGSHGEKWQQGSATPERRNERMWVWLLSASACVGGLGLGLGFFEKSARNQKHLLQSGEAVVGRVVSGDITTYKNSKTYWIRYQYKPDPDSEYFHSVTVPQAAYTQYTAGNPLLTVVYDPAEPYKSKPYFLLTAAELIGR